MRHKNERTSITHVTRCSGGLFQGTVLVFDWGLEESHQIPQSGFSLLGQKI